MAFVPILPMRHGNISYLWIDMRTGLSSDPTYEAWKLLYAWCTIAFASKFRSYL